MSNKSASSSEIVLAYPGEEQWELWTGDTKKGSGVLRHERSDKGNASSPSEFRGVSHYAFPVTSVFCSPFWAAAEDESLVPDIVEMRLEANGTKPDYGMGQHYDFVTLDREEERSLLMPILIADGKPIDLPKGDADHFDISPNFLALPRNHLVLWRELGRWVAVATRKGQPAYFQALNSTDLNADAMLELKCLLMQLHGQGVIEDLTGIVVWSRQLNEESRALLEAEAEMNVHVEDRPHPLLPERLLDLLPNSVAENRETAAKRQKIRNWISAAALFYVLMLAGFAAFFFWKKQEVTKLTASVGKLRQDVGWIEPTANRWNALGDAIHLDRFPLELFLRALQDMPETGVRVLDYDVNTDRILLKGEAVNRSMANRYISKLKANKTLGDYEWTHQPFKMDKTGIVTFELKGDYLYGSA
ncbi:MAG: hypothetical protein GWQ08_09160 [Verrucomicrobiaceae bacterium]|nr:hypothetical protein [Verrucomicrobiaceae bacterium]